MNKEQLSRDAAPQDGALCDAAPMDIDAKAGKPLLLSTFRQGTFRAWVNTVCFSCSVQCRPFLI